MARTPTPLTGPRSTAAKTRIRPPENPSPCSNGGEGLRFTPHAEDRILRTICHNNPIGGVPQPRHPNRLRFGLIPRFPGPLAPAQNTRQLPATLSKNLEAPGKTALYTEVPAAMPEFYT